MPRRRTSSKTEVVFRALAHHGRRRLLERLSGEGGVTLGELVDGLRMTRQAVSQHLDLLEEAGLVVTRWSGREKLHYLNPVPLQEVYEDWMAPLITNEARNLTQLRALIETGKSTRVRRRRS